MSDENKPNETDTASDTSKEQEQDLIRTDSDGFPLTHDGLRVTGPLHLKIIEKTTGVQMPEPVRRPMPTPEELEQHIQNLKRIMR